MANLDFKNQCNTFVAQFGAKALQQLITLCAPYAASADEVLKEDHWLVQTGMWQMKAQANGEVVPPFLKIASPQGNAADDDQWMERGSSDHREPFVTATGGLDAKAIYAKWNAAGSKPKSGE